MIDIDTEEFVPVDAVPDRLPPRRSGREIHESAVYRWIQRGIRGVRLEAIKLGGRTYTSVEAYRFPHGTTASARERMRRDARACETPVRCQDVDIVGFPELSAGVRACLSS